MKMRNVAVILLILGVAFAGCKKAANAPEGSNTNQKESAGTEMTAKSGSNVSMNYTLKVDGKVVDTSEGHEPLVFVLGSGQIIPGLDEQLVGMKKGDKKHVVVSPDKGYGELDEKAVQKVPRTAFQGMKDMKVGDVVTGRTEDQEIHARVASIGKDEVTLDFNHPLAGKTLEFDVEIVSVQ